MPMYMTLGLFELTAIAAARPLALVESWSTGLGPIGQTVPFRLLVSDPSRPEWSAPAIAAREPGRRPPDPWTARRRCRV